MSALAGPVAARCPDASGPGQEVWTGFGLAAPSEEAPGRAQPEPGSRSASRWTGKGDPRKDTDGGTSQRPWTLEGRMCKCASNETAVLGWPGLACKCTVQHRVNRKTAVKHLKHCRIGGTNEHLEISKEDHPRQVERYGGWTRVSDTREGPCEVGSCADAWGHQELEEAGSTLPEAFGGLWPLGRPDCGLRASRAVGSIRVRSVTAASLRCFASRPRIPTHQSAVPDFGPRLPSKPVRGRLESPGTETVRLLPGCTNSPSPLHSPAS